jgi:hypothetical protein
MRNPSIKTLKKKLDRIFSEYIRKRDKGVCFTSGVKKHWKEQQAGHFYSRNLLGTRYDERNVHCQTVRDNIFLKGNLIQYTINMIELYGEKVWDELRLHSKWSLVKFAQSLGFPAEDTKQAYQWLITYYTEKLKEL